MKIRDNLLSSSNVQSTPTINFAFNLVATCIRWKKSLFHNAHQHWYNEADQKGKQYVPRKNCYATPELCYFVDLIQLVKI
mmetsp:Transcript_12235/g.34973  ORF Transcript_12235/g.34973 Transcript_12235/m.34973 type:complete len:80 (+) Transcript_12235:146-385(+)